MRLLITGACGFIGSALALCFLAGWEDLELVGVDNLMRPGSETNRRRLEQLGVTFIHAD